MLYLTVSVLKVVVAVKGRKKDDGEVEGGRSENGKGNTAH
jgi:hypothetical protein